MISILVELIKNGFSFFQKKQQNKADEVAQNQITLEETRQGYTWRQGLGWVLTFIVLWNYVIIPVLAAFGVLLPPVPIEAVWKVLIILVGQS
ncbi:hypothetical protein [Enterobacter sp.]|uniref:hypothetical protein n=1 Tax=Enterobacter sp. TaxID=42895 RepID=UPI00296EE08C|nr:hypothetical protein [Enterobacter sp.]